MFVVTRFGDLDSEERLQPRIPWKMRKSTIRKKANLMETGRLKEEDEERDLDQINDFCSKKWSRSRPHYR